jgi:hypothetical protein
VCQSYRHLARNKEKCDLRKDANNGEACPPQCGQCPGRHTTNKCTTPRVKKDCCNCSDTHNAFNISGPTFIKKAQEYNQRNPNNLLPYFITDKSYTQNILPTNTPHNPTLTQYTPPEKNPSLTQRQTTLNNYQRTRPPSTAASGANTATPGLPPHPNWT